MCPADLIVRGGSPVRACSGHALLDRHPRHRTAHGGLLKDILDVLAGSSPPARPSEPGALREELSPSELRVLRYLPSNLSTAPSHEKEGSSWAHTHCGMSFWYTEDSMKKAHGKGRREGFPWDSFTWAMGSEAGPVKL